MDSFKLEKLLHFYPPNGFSNLFQYVISDFSKFDMKDLPFEINTKIRKEVYNKKIVFFAIKKNNKDDKNQLQSL